MKVAVLQPGYLPWLGFFEQIARVDTFVVYDDVQYTVNDWRNRNRIKTPTDVSWLTVPVKKEKHLEKFIKDIEIDNSQHWQIKHLGKLQSSYNKAKYFTEIMELIDEIFKKDYKFLIDVDMDFINKVNEYLSVSTKLIFSSNIPSVGSKSERLLSICKYFSTTHYLSGSAARNYLKESIFTKDGIVIEWQDYKHPYYNQLWLKEQGFISHLSIIDLLFNQGPDSLAILTGEKIIEKPDWVVIKHADDFKKT